MVWRSVRGSSVQYWPAPTSPAKRAHAVLNVLIPKRKTTWRWKLQTKGEPRDNDLCGPTWTTLPSLMDPNPELHTGSPLHPSLTSPHLTSHPPCYQLQDCNEQRGAETETKQKFSKDSLSEGMKLRRGPTGLYKPFAFCFLPSVFAGISLLLSFPNRTNSIYVEIQHGWWMGSFRRWSGCFEGQTLARLRELYFIDRASFWSTAIATVL